MAHSEIVNDVVSYEDVNTKASSVRVVSGAASHRWGVILAGGDGTRLQPLTRLACGDDRPKQFCSLLAGKTLLEHTRRRISLSIDRDRILYVLTRKHEPYYQEAMNGVSPSRKVIQSHNQGTLPAILWSLMRIYRSDPQAVVAFFPSDHYFAHEGKFAFTVERSLDFVEKKPAHVTLIGVSAERPETEYGWIEPDVRGGDGIEHGFAPVRRFWEKPPRAVAWKLLTQGCLWNTFVMVGSVGAFLEMIRRVSPLLYATFEIALLFTAPELETQAMELVYDTIIAADFSREVLAVSAGRLLVTSCGDAGWSDLGEPRRFIEALTENGLENPWSLADTCSKCGLKREQLISLSHPGSSRGAYEEELTSTCSN